MIGSHTRVRSCSFLGTDQESEHILKKAYLSTPSSPSSATIIDLLENRTGMSKSPLRDKLRDRKILFSGISGILLFLFCVMCDV